MNAYVDALATSIHLARLGALARLSSFGRADHLPALSLSKLALVYNALLSLAPNELTIPNGLVYIF